MSVHPLPGQIQRDYPLERLTTIRIGGPADFYARPESERAVVELLAWAESEGVELGIVGSGSNLLVSDRGFRGLVIKLAGGLTRIARRGAAGVLSALIVRNRIDNLDLVGVLKTRE